jgi:AbiV family abortive infection protein
VQTRAIKDLVQLSEVDFCVAVAEGLTRVVENVNRLGADAVVLADAGHFHGSRVLTAIAEEEASKFLILLDAVRCPRHPGERLSTQLARFNDHLAKGLYAKASMYRPSTLGELQHYLDLDRDQYYLDGPNDCGWVFYNEIMHTGEAQLYVDYIYSDDGHGWSEPSRMSDLFGAPHERACVSLVRALSAVGIATPAALSTVG